MLESLKSDWWKMPNSEGLPFLRGARTRFRGSRLKIIIRVKACFKQVSLVLSIHISTLKFGPKLGVLPLDLRPPT